MGGIGRALVSAASASTQGILHTQVAVPLLKPIAVMQLLSSAQTFWEGDPQSQQFHTAGSRSWPQDLHADYVGESRLPASLERYLSRISGYPAFRMPWPYEAMIAELPTSLSAAR